MRGLDALRSRYAALELRERRVLLGGALALSLMLLYVAVIEPLYVVTPQRSERLQTLKEDLVALERLAARAGVDTTEVAKDRRPDDTSLLARVDQVASATGVRASIRRLQPEAEGSRIRVELDGAPFEGVARWLADLDARYGITVASLSLDRADEGLVDGSLTLSRTP